MVFAANGIVDDLDRVKLVDVMCLIDRYLDMYVLHRSRVSPRGTDCDPDYPYSCMQETCSGNNMLNGWLVGWTVDRRGQGWNRPQPKV